METCIRLARMVRIRWSEQLFCLFILILRVAIDSVSFKSFLPPPFSNTSNISMLFFPIYRMRRRDGGFTVILCHFSFNLLFWNLFIYVMVHKFLLCSGFASRQTFYQPFSSGCKFLRQMTVHYNSWMRISWKIHLPLVSLIKKQ